MHHPIISIVCILSPVLILPVMTALASSSSISFHCMRSQINIDRQDAAPRCISSTTPRCTTHLPLATIISLLSVLSESVFSSSCIRILFCTCLPFLHEIVAGNGNQICPAPSGLTYTTRCHDIPEHGLLQSLMSKGMVILVRLSYTVSNTMLAH